MNKAFTTIVNLLGIAIVLAVAAYILLPMWQQVDQVDIIVTPESLPPDGQSEAVIKILFINSFGFEAPGRQPEASFVITQGMQSAELVSRSQQSARLRAGFVAGEVRLRITIEGFPFPREVVIPVRPRYARIRIGGLDDSRYQCRSAISPRESYIAALQQEHAFLPLPEPIAGRLR